MHTLGDDPILKQLQYIVELLNRILEKFDEISRPSHGRNILWRLFFPYGEFAGQKAAAKEAQAIMLDVQARLDDMVDTLQKRNHPLAGRIGDLVYLDLKDMSDRLVELPTREQFMGQQIMDFGQKVKRIIQDIKQDKSA